MDTPLARLCAYYLDCLAAEDPEGFGVSAYASSKHDLDYVEIAAHPLLSPVGLSTMFEEDGVRRLVEELRRKQGDWDLFLGYPVLVHRVRGRSGWEGNIVIPILIWPLEKEQDRSYAAYTLSDEVPQPNLRAFKHLLEGGLDNQSIIEQVASLQEELGIDDSCEDVPEINEIASRLRKSSPSWPWRERVNVSRLAKNPKLSGELEVGIYNRTILITTKRPTYTRGLEWELQALQQIPESTYANTALGQWLNGKDVGSHPDDASPLIEIFPLNAEQRQTVRQGLQNELTVVTGPPGTGKSQVVSSLLINAAWKGKQVLFASKNNKAVDVVEERVNGLGPRPALIRMGSREHHRAKLAEYLSQLLSATAGENERKAYETALAAHEVTAGRFHRLTEREREIVDLRNRVDALEQAAEPARRAVGNTSFSQWAATRDIEAFDKQLRDLKAALWAADYSRQPFLTKMLWGLVGEGRSKRLNAVVEGCQPLFRDAQINWPEEYSRELAQIWAEPVAKLEEWLSQARSAREYFSSLMLLNEASSLEKIAEERCRMSEDLEQHSKSLWEHWLNLTPDRLTPNDRRLLGDYAAALKMDTDWRLRDRLSHIVNALPCWAVTSLSARGRIPFQPGFFDLVVVDEASQCDIASALPLLYRAKRAMVIGDPHQLKHISTLQRQDEQLLARHAVGRIGIGWSYSTTSLYDLATHVCRSEDIVRLKDHYRSHAQIIGFSNQRFYEGVLRVATRYENLRRTNPGGPAIRWIDVRGQALRGQARRPGGGSAVNEEECQAVVAELRRLALEQGYKGTIGVVSPFRAQVERIQYLIGRDERLSFALERREFLVGTAHGFQGDERDVIIFSPVVTLGMENGATNFLSKNYNLFNVAITRARAALVVVGDRVAVANSGIEHLEKLPEYVDSLVGTPRRETAAADLGPTYPPVDNLEQVSDWEKQFYEGLYAAGLRPRVQYPVEQYLLDFALLAPGRKLDIEVDGERYHKNWDGELLRRDQIRNQRLIELGWDVMRFWVYQIRDDFDACIAKVQAWADAARD